MIVADCTAIVHVLVAGTLDDELADRLGAEPIQAPHLLDVEVLHAIRG